MKRHRANLTPTLIHPCLKTCQAGEALINPYRTRGSAVVLNVITGVTQARLQFVSVFNLLFASANTHFCGFCGNKYTCEVE